MAYAEGSFELYIAAPGQPSLAEQNEQAAKSLRARGVPPDQLPMTEPPGSVPPAAEFVWRVFQELCRTRQGGFGPGPITNAEIFAWSQLTGQTLALWELRALRRLDSLWLSVASAKSNAAAV